MEGRIEYYRPRAKELQGKYSVTITVPLPSTIHDCVVVAFWQNEKGESERDIHLEEKEEYILYHPWIVPIGSRIVIVVTSPRMRSYTQINRYDVTEEGILLNIDESDIVYTFVPIELIDLDVKKG